jgi:ATP-dependent protease ClpP protease subunit
MCCVCLCLSFGIHFICDYHHIYLNKSITDHSVDSIISQIEFIRFRHKNKFDDESGIFGFPVLLHIDSHGGDFLPAFHLMKYIQQHNVYCVAHNAHSSAFDIFQYCHKRFVFYHSILFQHKLQFSNLDGTYDEILAIIQFANNLNNEAELFIANRLHLSLKEYQNMIGDEFMLIGGDDIIDENFADLLVENCPYKIKIL